MIGEAAGVRILLFDFPARIRGEQAIQNEWRFVHSGRDFLGCEWPELIGHMGIGFDAWIVAVFCIDQVHSLPGRRFANANLPRGQYQMPHFPHHKNFATFDYSAAAVTQPQIEPFCSGQFTEEAHNLILVGGTGTGKTHIAIALGTTLISNGKKARFFNAVDLINALIKEQAEGNAGKIIRQLSALDCVIILSRQIAAQSPAGQWTSWATSRSQNPAARWFIGQTAPHAVC